MGANMIRRNKIGLQLTEKLVQITNGQRILMKGCIAGWLLWGKI